MSVFFGSDYVTQIDDLVFTPSSGQFGPDNPGFFYDEFFGVGEDDPVGGPFSVGGDVIVDVPFKGDVELFTARLYGEVGAKFGLNVSASLDPGSIDALLPYETVVAYPDIDLAMVGDGDVIDIFFGNTFTPEANANSGFTTEFPSITFQLDVIAELQARLAAELGAFGGDPIDFEVFDFNAATAIPIISLDTNRQITAEDIDPGDEDVLTVGDANPLEVLGVTTPELVEELVEAYPDITATENSDGEFNGLSLPLNTFVSAPAAEEEPPADVEKEGDEQPEEEEPDLSGIDLGSMSVFIPNINAVSGGYDGNVFVVDPTQKAQYNRDENGVLTGIDRLPDADGQPNSAGDGKAQNIAELVLDLDGLVTYSTGGLFPPLELGSSSSGSFGPAYYDADFYFNLFDAELLAELPLVQEFSLTPDIVTQLQFFEANPDGTKQTTTNAEGEEVGVEKLVTVRTERKVLTFDETGTFRDATVEARLRQLAESNQTYANDIDLFVDFDKGISGGFTGQTASVGGRMIISRDGGKTWEELVTNVSVPIAFSEPDFGQNQNLPLELDDDTLLGYRLFIGSGSAEVIEDYVIEFNKDDSVYVEEVEATEALISETPFLDELAALNLVYDDDDTFVEVVHKAVPIVTNRTGLEFDLSLLLRGLEAGASFSAGVDIGPFDIGVDLGFDFGPLLDEEFLRFSADLIDFFNDSFQIEDSRTTSFVLGQAAGPSEYGDAIVLTDGKDTYTSTLTGTDANEQIIALGGADSIDAGIGNDTINLGVGTDSIDGGDGFDTLDLSDLGGRVFASAVNRQFGSLSLQIQGPGERIGLQGTGNGATVKGRPIELELYSYDLVTGAGNIHSATNVERVILSDLNDEIGLHAGVRPEVWETGAGRDWVPISSGDHDPITLRTGDDDDIVQVAAGTTLNGSTLDGGAGHDYLRIDSSIDLEDGIGPLGATFLNFESVASFTDNGTSQTFRGTDGANTLDGQGGEDTLEGRGGNDLLIGGADNDTLIGGAGADSMVGGTGTDAASYADSATSVFIDLDFGGVARGFRGEAQGDTFSSVEHIIGSAFEDIIIGDNAGNTLDGGGGDDRLQSQDGDDLLIGGLGNDLLNRGTTATLNANFNNVYDGGEGFDIVAVDVFQPFTQTGSRNGTATFSYTVNTSGFPTYNTATTTDSENVTISHRYLRTAHVELFLDETGSGTISYIEDDATDRFLTTFISGTAKYSSRSSSLDFVWDVRSTSYSNNIIDQTPEALLNDGISFTKGDYHATSGSGKITNPGGRPSDIAGGTFGSEQVVAVEGIIASNGNDILGGNSQANAIYGNGGIDLILGGGGDDLLGFGEAQSLTDVFSFPGSGSVDGPGRDDGDTLKVEFDTLESRLALMDPYGSGNEAGVTLFEIVPVGTLNLDNGGTEDIGSFLWGMGGANAGSRNADGGHDTLDLRFDRGLDFFPDLSTNYAVVDLNIAADNAERNAYTREAVQYGRATYYDAEGNELNFATTFGIHNVLGTRNNDTITGDREINTITGGDGADIMDGDADFDTLSYATASEAVTLNFREDAGSMILDNGRETVTGAGDATGDVGRNFELTIGSDHDDTAILAGSADSVTAELPVTFDYFTYQGIAPVTITTTETITFESLNADSLAVSMALDMGAGDDEVIIEGFGAHDVDLGDGDDTAVLKNIGNTIDGGAGNDQITVLAHDQISLQDVAAGDRTTTIDGGADEDTVILTGGDYVSLELTDTGAVVTERVIPPFSATEFFFLNPQFGPQTELLTDEPEYIAARNAANSVVSYDLTNVEFVEIDGQRIRIDNPDPVVDADKTISLIEDQVDPYDLGLSLTAEDPRDPTVTSPFEITALPTTALITTDLGVPVSIGEVFTAEQMNALQVVPGQDFDPNTDGLSFRRVGDAPEDTMTVTLPDTVRGVALNITSHLTEETIEVTPPVTPVATVAMVGLNPGLLASDLPAATSLDYAQSASVTDMPTGAFTYEMLFQSFGELDPAGPEQVFASYSAGGNNNEFLLYGYRDGRGLEVSFNGTRIETGIRLDEFYDREMHRLSIRVDPDANLIEVLGDGDLRFSQIATINGGIDANGFLIIGQEQDAPGGGFNAGQTLSGQIGDVRIWDGLRTDAEIRDNAFVEIADPGAEADLAVNWRADASNQGVMVNAKGGDHLALVNSPDVADIALPDLPTTTVIDTIRVNVSPATNQYIQSSGTPMPTGDVTIEFLMQPTDLPEEFTNRQHFASYAVAAPGSTNEFLMWADGGANGTLGLAVGGNAGIITDIPTSVLYDGEAHRVSVTADTTTNEVAVYIDGVEQYRGPGRGDVAMQAGGSFNFGQEQDAVGGGFDSNQIVRADFGDIRLWNTVHTEEEIADNAFIEFADPASEANLVANWQVDPANAASVPDLLGGNAMAQVGNPITGSVVVEQTATPETPADPGTPTTITQVVDQQGDPVTITVTEVPSDGTVFYMSPDPALLAVGITFEIETPVSVGQELTPAQLEGLYFKPTLNFTGDPGQFSYTVTDDVSFRQLTATSGAETDNRTDGATNDGSATQVISFDVTSVNDAPEIANVLFPVSPGANLESTVRVADVEGNAFTVTLTEAPMFGTVLVNPDGSFTYQQNTTIDFAGAAFVEDSFTVVATETPPAGFFSNVEPETSGPQRQTIRIFNPAQQSDIVFDPNDADYFDDNGDPINIGGLETNDVIIGHSGKDGLYGFGGHDRVEGREDADFLSGGTGNDTLLGEAGNDTLDGGEGSDRLDGGEGIDTVDYSSEASGITLILSSTGSSGAAQGDAIVDIENAKGTDFADFMTGDAENNTFWGGELNDTLNGRGGDDYLMGEEDNDRLLGGAGNDTLEGGAGDDLLQGQGGEDMLRFGAAAGNDTAFDFELGLDKLDFSDLGLRFVDLALLEAAGSTRVEYADGTGGMASVTLQGITVEQVTSGVMADPTGLGSPGGGVTLLEGDTGNNNIAGGSDGEDFVGGAGNDTLNARGGDDTMVGGLGDDQYFVEQAGDVVIEQANQGYDLVRSAVSFTLGANIEAGATRNDNVVIDITGNELNNALTGNSQSNTLIDDLGRDRLRGGGGDDTLNGGADADVLEGGTGADVFVFDADSGIDLITDFEVGVDVIDVTSLGIAYADMRIQDGPLGAQVYLDLTPGSVDLITLTGVQASQLLLDSFITVFGANQPPIVGTPGNDNLTGSQIDDEVQGLGGNDRVNGLGGADTMIGGLGDDEYTVDNAGDMVVELAGEGTDLIRTSLDLTLPSHVENGTAQPGAAINLTGNAEDNVLNGNDFVNTLSGLGGADTLLGKDGEDVLNGGADNDQLRGGGGADRFEFATGDGDDTIIDFEIGVDIIDMSATGLAFGDLTLNDTGASMPIDFGLDSIVLLNTDPLDLTESLFDFGV